MRSMPTDNLEKLGGLYLVGDDGKFRKLGDLRDVEITEGTDGEHDYVFEGSGDKKLLKIFMDAMGIKEK